MKDDYGSNYLFHSDEDEREDDGSIFGKMICREGGWSLSSKTDPRWNCNGYSKCVGGFVMPEECEQKLNELKQTLGEPPKDLEWSYCKY